jgi:hypothetical protein
LREIPGFLAFTAIFILLFIREQLFAILSLAVMCIGIAITGLFPAVLGLYLTTILIMGFHYFETVNQSLTLQWIDKQDTAGFLGKALAWRAAAALSGYASIWLVMTWLKLDYAWMYGLIGCLGLLMVVTILFYFPRYDVAEIQHKK